MQTPIHDALIAFVSTDFATAFPTISLVTANAPFDWNNPPPNFVHFETQFLNGAQVGMAADPKTRISGCVYVIAYAREGTGVRQSQLYLDWFNSKLKYARVGTVLLQEPRPAGSHPAKGFWTEHLKVEFYSDPT